MFFLVDDDGPRSMTSDKQVQIITVYNAGQSAGSRLMLRLLAVLSLLVASVWLVEALYPHKLFNHNTVERWVKGKLLVAGAVGFTNTMEGAQQDPWVALGLQRPDLAGARPTAEQQAKLVQQNNAEIAVLTIDFYVWKIISAVAGGWLALAALLGIAGRRVSLRMHRQAAVLMILATLATIAAIEVAIRWGGMPAGGNLKLYAKIGAVQSAYAWFVLIATLFVR